MTNDKPEAKDGSLESLIGAEADAALARFRSGDFEADIRKRIEKAPRTKPQPRYVPILIRPVWAAIAASLFVIALGFALFYRPAPRADLARSIEKMLRLAPGIETLEAGFSAPDRTPRAVSDVPDAIHLAAVIAGSANPSPAQPSGRDEAAPQKLRDVRPLSLEEIYKILSIDKSIERVLALITS